MNKMLRYNFTSPASAALQFGMWVPKAKHMLLFLLLGFIMTSAANAQAEPYTYQPDYCEFKVTFPEKPVIKATCDDEEKTRCYDLVTFNQVFDLMATTRFKVICNVINENIKDNYSDETIIQTLEAMTQNSVVQTFNTNVETNEDGYKLAGLVGEGRAGLAPTIFVAQLWIGDISAFSLEAELLGDAFQPADELFRDVLNSVQYTGIVGLGDRNAAPQLNLPDSVKEMQDNPE